MMTSQNKIAVNKEELARTLKTLGIRSLHGDDLDVFLDEAKRNKWSPTETINHLAKRELIERERRSLEWRLRDSKIMQRDFRPMADFDWGWPDKIDRPVVEGLLTADFVEHGHNVVLIGSHGLGKSMIAKNIIHRAVHDGYTALFVETAEMLVDLGAQDSSRALERRIKHYAKPKVLCIDEVGYLSYDQRSADLLFQVVSRRYERKSIIITTNLAFNDWDTVFPGATSVVSLVDRLIHHSEITLIEGESYRKHQAEQQKAARKNKRSKK
jgi:DNA replication protein DnaC